MQINSTSSAAQGQISSTQANTDKQLTLAQSTAKEKKNRGQLGQTQLNKLSIAQLNKLSVAQLNKLNSLALNKLNSSQLAKLNAA